MPQIIITPTAQDDLREIGYYLGQVNPNSAVKMLRSINSKFQLLAQHPQMGRLRHEFLVDLRSFPVGRHIIFYQEIENGVEILRVLHGSRDLSRVFDEMIDG